MAEREPAEFEMVLGNKQLLSVLLLVVILLGVFFAMGYLAGQSGAARATGSPVKKAAEPEPVAPPRPAPSQPPPAPRELTTEAAQDPGTAPGAAQTQPPEPPPAAPRVPAPPDGKYLQAAALPRPQAEAMVNLFIKDGQPAHLALSPKKTADLPDLYRVLVGPLADNAQIAALRAYLKEKGVDKPIPRSYPDAPQN